MKLAKPEWSPEPEDYGNCTGKAMPLKADIACLCCSFGRGNQRSGAAGLTGTGRKRSEVAVKLLEDGEQQSQTGTKGR